jgi:hypothetical protein
MIHWMACIFHFIIQLEIFYDETTHNYLDYLGVRDSS